MSQEAKTDALFIRIEPSVKTQFNEACAHYPGTPSDVLRWLIVAFADGRVTVEQPK